MKIKRITIGTSSILTIILVLFIYSYAKQQNWKILQYLAGAYLFLVLGIIGLAIIIFILVSLILLSFFWWTRRVHTEDFKSKHKIEKESIDADYKIKK